MAHDTAGRSERSCKSNDDNKLTSEVLGVCESGLVNLMRRVRPRIDFFNGNC